MNVLLAASVALWTMAAAALAQPAAPAPSASAPSAPACPGGGLAKPVFGVFGDNDGVTRAYEVASPCIPEAVRKAATAIGMGRFKPLGVKNVTTIRFVAKGVFGYAGEAVAPATVDIGMSYVLPAARVDVTRTVGAKPSRTIRAFSAREAWTESAPGVDRTRGGDWRQLAPLLKLTPYGAVWSLVDAEGAAVVTAVGGRTRITGASPYDGYPVAVTLDEKDRPVAVEVVADGVRYGATFSGYSDKWESAYLNIFPEQMHWTRNGKPMADLTVTAFHSNPYVVFPPPAKP